jgi:glucosylglycerate synthase
MATANSISEVTPTTDAARARLLVFVAPMAADKLQSVLASLSTSFLPDELLVATPDGITSESYPALRIVPVAASNTAWTLTATDFINVHQLAQKHEVQAILMLGQEADSLSSTSIAELASAVLTAGVDVAIPCYDLPPRAGLANSAILYPLSRALFASRVRFPLAVDLGLSLRMVERLALAAQRFPATNQGESFLWPVSEAAIAGFTIQEFDVGSRILPQPAQADLNTVLAQVTGSLFADIDIKASFWQRPRPVPPMRTPVAQPLSTDPPADTAPMLDAFRLAYTNLREIWSLVLTPNSLLGLKRLYASDPTTFQMPETLWVRIVYDFLLAYRLRTINRGHLLGALTPLYLAWVASYINILAAGTDAERSIETLAAAFEAEKPYLVSRWRWPDRFNP